MTSSQNFKVKTIIIQFLRATAECFARLSRRLGVSPSVYLSGRLSHSWSVSKRCKLGSRNIYCAPRCLVYRDKISCHWVQWFSSNEGVKEGYPLPLKRRHFTVIGSNNVKTVADRYIHAAYHNKHWWQAFGFINLDDLELRWTSPKWVLVNFSQFLDAAHILTLNCDEMAGVTPR